MNFKKLITIISILFLICIVKEDVFAVDTVPTEEQTEAFEKRKALPVETNEIEGWPNGPLIGAEAAVVMDVNTGTVIYSKNPNEELFPASTTKILTGLLVIENSTMDEMVTFSRDAIWNIDRDSTHLAIDVGEQMSVKDCLYGLLLASANEVAYGLAEHVGGDLDSFVKMMNDRAEKIGCKNTHFANANGLPNENHYTSAYDLALIAKECFANETFCSIASTVDYTISPTNKQPNKRHVTNHHRMLPTLKHEYEGCLGGKTGFTKVARQTLVTCAERDGMRLVCVVMKDESPYQFLDTISLLDYAFGSFQKMNIAENEKRYNLDSHSLYKTDFDILGSSKPILSINPVGDVIVPRSTDFGSLDVELEYNNDLSDCIAQMKYYIGGNYIGETTLEKAKEDNKPKEFSDVLNKTNDIKIRKIEPDHLVIFINVKELSIIFLIVIFIVFIVLFVIDQIRRYLESARRNQKLTRTRYKKRSENQVRVFRRKRSRDEEKF